MLSIIVATIVGNLLGSLVCRLLFRSSSAGPLEKEKK
jgi:formate/nitrite transporter FocA (FNT family)